MKLETSARIMTTGNVSPEALCPEGKISSCEVAR